MSDLIESVGAKIQAINDFLFNSGNHLPGKQILVTLDHEARNWFQNWDELRKQDCASLDVRECPALGGWISKSDKLLLSIAFVVMIWEDISTGELFSKETFTISKRHLEEANQVCEYLKECAKRLYTAQDFEKNLIVAKKILERIMQKSIVDGMTVRDLKKQHFAGLRDSKSVDNGLSVLEEYSWLRLRSVPSKGRSSTIIEINPKIFPQRSQPVAVAGNAQAQPPEPLSPPRPGWKASKAKKEKTTSEPYYEPLFADAAEVGQ